MTFFLKHAAFLVVVFLMVFAVQNLLNPEWLHPAIYGIWSFFLAQTALVAIINYFGILSKDGQGPLFFLASMVIRLLTSIAALTVALLWGVEAVETFVINFFLIYFLLILFELYTLIANLRQNLENPKRNEL